jgi:two-component system, NarL family, response regulator NreC
MKVKILMVDDHPSMIEGYKIILSYNELGYEVDTVAAYNCKDAYDLLTNEEHPADFDVVFLDYSLPAYEEKHIKSGEDLAEVIKDKLPTCKIVMLTSHTEALLLYGIIKSVNPIGLLVKSDFTAEELLSAFDLIMNDKVYHSETVKENIKELLSKKIYLDNFNRQIISLLAQGVKTKSLPDHLNLSISAIEKRKVQIRDYFCVRKGTDEDIIREAKKLGLI